MNRSSEKPICVNRNRPCAVCKGIKRCSFIPDGLIFCRVREGPQQGFKDLGKSKTDPQCSVYLPEERARLQESNGRPPLRRAASDGSKPAVNWKLRAEHLVPNLTRERRKELADDLGVPEGALHEIPLLGFNPTETGKDNDGISLGPCWMFPEYDGAGAVIGLRRRSKDGRKKVCYGANAGLTIPTNWRDRFGSLFLPEGASDVLALTALGLAAVGRPNDTGGVEFLADLLRDWPADRQIIVLAEWDMKGDGTWPGLEAAKRTAAVLQEKLGRKVEWALPPDKAKDVREWVKWRNLDPTCADAWSDAGEEFVRGLNAQPVKLADGAQPRPAAPEVLSWRPFPVELLPEPVRGFIVATATAVVCDPVFVALPTLAGLASAIGNSRRIELKRDWHEPSILWTVGIAESGAKKSPPLDKALAPLYERQRKAMKEHAEKIKEFKKAKQRYEVELALWKKGKGVGEPPEEPEEPVCGRCWIDDATVEVALRLLSRQWRGLLMKRDEFSGWLGSFGQYSKSGKTTADASKWIEMHGGRIIVNDRVGSGTACVERAALCMTGNIQPGVVKRVMGQEYRENGLLARLLLAYPPRMQTKWSKASAEASVKEALHKLYDKLFSLEPDEDEEHNKVPINLMLTPAAERVWADFVNELGAEQIDRTGDLAAAWQKLEGYAARFALAIQCVKWAAADLPETLPGPVDVESIEAGIALSRWFGHEAERIYAILAETPAEEKLRDRAELIRRKGGRASPRDLMRWRDREFPTSERAAKALQELVDTGYGSWEHDDHGGGRGHPVSRFILRTDTDTNSANAEENGICVSVSEEQEPENDPKEGEMEY